MTICSYFGNHQRVHAISEYSSVSFRILCSGAAGSPGRIRVMLGFALLCLLSVVGYPESASADTCEDPDPEKPWALVFSDEFYGDSLDRSLWNTEMIWGSAVIINNEQQYYAGRGEFGYDPFTVNDGVLSIAAIKTPFYQQQKLYLTRSYYSAHSVELLWRTPTDADRYRVYRDGELQGETATAAWYDTDLREGIDYTYQIVALDRAGGELRREQLTVNTVDRPRTPERRPFSLALEARVYSDSSAEILWRQPTRAVRYQVYQHGELLADLTSKGYRSYPLVNLVPGRRNEYEVRAYDLCDQLIISESVSVDTAGGVTPTPTLPRLVIDVAVFSPYSAELSWQPVAGASFYRVTESDFSVSEGDQRSLYLADMLPGRERQFLVQALGPSGELIDQTYRTVNTANTGFALNRQPYLSGVINSYDSFRFRYGRVETRARFPAGQGYWGAVWLLNAYYHDDEPEDPEIDIIEALGHDTTTALHAYHVQVDHDGDGISDTTESHELSSQVSDFSENFHVYRVDWSPGEIVWFVDDMEVARVAGDQVSSEQMYLIANLAVGGDYPGAADETTLFPGAVEIDYIRVYQRR